MPTTLITGTSSGIGRATALHLARKGYHVFAGMRNPEAGSAVLTDTAQKEGLKLEVVQHDVTVAESCEQAVQTVLQQAGKIDVLVNNAGIGGGAAVEEMPEAFLRKIFDTNYFGAVRMIRLVLPAMRKRRSGTIVNITSVLGRYVNPCGVAYSGSKFALEAASEALAQEVIRFNIRVVIVEPGVVETPIFGKNKIEPDPNSPYYDFAMRKTQVFSKRLEDPSPPELVAETIHHAMETDTPKLRYLVGEDAEKWWAGRQRMTDEEWVETGREMTPEEHAAYHFQRFGIEI